MFKKIIIKNLSGKKIFQSLFKRLYIICLTGMNIGGGSGFYNTGEKAVIRYFNNKIGKKTTPVVFDVGANKGDYSLEILSVFKSNVNLYCFEPSKKTFDLLKSNLSGYENVKMYNLGLGKSNETAILYSNENASGMSSIFNRRLDHFDSKLENKEEIKLERIDSFCRNNNINHIHLLKLDVEGNEMNILKGAENLIRSNSIDFIQFEFGACNIDSKTFFQDFFYFLNPRYKIYRILKNGLVLINRYETTLEVFLTTNFLAVSRNYKQN